MRRIEIQAPDGQIVYVDQYSSTGRLHIVGFGVYRDSIEECKDYVSKHWFDKTTVTSEGPPYDAATATGMYDWY